jgi:hypothetical protein
MCTMCAYLYVSRVELELEARSGGGGPHNSGDEARMI